MNLWRCKACGETTPAGRRATPHWSHASSAVGTARHLCDGALHEEDWTAAELVRGRAAPGPPAGPERSPALEPDRARPDLETRIDAAFQRLVTLGRELRERPS